MKDATMTRRHFEFVSTVVNNLAVDRDIRLIIAYDFARAFEGCNASFRKDLFINACTLRDRKVKRKLTNPADTREVENDPDPVSRTYCPK